MITNFETTQMSKKVIIPNRFKRQVCRYELAKILHEFGVKNISLLHYMDDEDVVNGEHITCGMLMNPIDQVSAYNMTELTYMLGHRFMPPHLIPITHFSKHDKEGTFGLYSLERARYFEVGADAYATLVIELIENEQLTVENVNNRIQKFFNQ